MDVRPNFFRSLSPLIKRGIRVLDTKGKRKKGAKQEFVWGDRNRQEGGPLLGFFPLEDFSSGKRRLEEEEEDGREEGSSSTILVSFLPLSIFPSLDCCISSSIYVLVSFFRV